MDSDVTAQQVTKEFSMGKVPPAILTALPVRTLNTVIPHVLLETRTLSG